MGKRLKAQAPGSFERKKLSFAPTDQIDAYSEVATHFMFAIFELEPGDYLITDESDVLDFVPMDETDTSDFWERIEVVYGIAQSDVGSGLLVKIFEVIANRQRAQ